VIASCHEPEDTLYKQMAFVLRYEGLNLLVFKKLFKVLPQKEVEEMAQIKSLGQSNHKIWFLYE